jgi:hypothetical protein
MLIKSVRQSFNAAHKSAACIRISLLNTYKEIWFSPIGCVMILMLYTGNHTAKIYFLSSFVVFLSIFLPSVLLLIYPPFSFLWTVT